MMTRIRYENDDDDEHNLFTNRSTMMANFEEWIKMATDNKINSRNSWNFALIDYFHDLNVLRDSENNINFQKASATLDGCVKIYSSRVDSVTTETGKLLSGLAQKKMADKRGLPSENGDDGNGINPEGAGEDEAEDSIQIDPSTGLPISNDPEAHARRRIHNRILETTLVDFETIRMKELDQELNIDPLFKKALVDFDEGGSKSLLLNTLNIDSSARVVFDTGIKDTKVKEGLNDDEVEEEEEKEEQEEQEKEIERDEENASRASASMEMSAGDSLAIEEPGNNTLLMEDEILALGMDFIKFTDISNCEISPSIQQLRNVVDDINKAKTFIDGVNGKFDNFLSEQELQEAVPEIGFDDVNGESGELQDDLYFASPKEVGDYASRDDGSNSTENPIEIANANANEFSIIDDDNTNMGGIFEQDLMAYFDESLKKNWRGRDHWKVRNFKKKNLLNADENDKAQPISASGSSKNAEDGTMEEASKTKKKKQFEIDFFAFNDKLEETIFASKKRTNIEMSQKSRTNESHYLLPDDFHFSTQKITRLFIKPEQTMSLFNRRPKAGQKHFTESLDIPSGQNVDTAENNEIPTIADEQFWAENYDRKEREEKEGKTTKEEEDIKTGILDNPFEDDDAGVDFNQAFEDEEFRDEGLNSLPTDESGKLPFAEHKVNYSRVSKKVDVRRLKNNLWTSINILADKYKANDPGDQKDVSLELKFTDIAEEISKRYSEEVRKDISTSFCFICLLHLANEYGLKITSTENDEDLVVVYDMKALS